jgi:hypothetical protein
MGVLCWLFDNALNRGWVAGANRAAVAAEIEAVLDGGPPVLDRSDWEAVVAFLRDEASDVVTSLSQGDEFPSWRLAWDAGTWCPPIRNTAEPQEKLEALWEQLSEGTRWDLGMTTLRARQAPQWRPRCYRFSDLTLSSSPGEPEGLVPVKQETENA